MKVLHVYKTFFPDTKGGIEQVIHTLASHTQSLGISNRVLTLTQAQPRIDTDQSGYKIIRYKENLHIASTGFSWKFLKHFKKEVAWADVLHMHFPWPFADLCYELSRIKTPTVLSYHSDIVKQAHLSKLYQPLLNRHFENVDIICAASPGVMKSSPILNKFKNKTRMVTYGIEHHECLSLKDLAVFEWQKRFGERFFLYLGALRYYKGLHILIDALKGRDYPVVIAGQGTEECSLKDKVNSMGLKNVFFLSEVTNKQKNSLMRAAYGFVLPSHLRSEAFGIVLVEAAQQGTPMISCELGTGTSYVNQHEKTGLVIPPSDPRALGNALDIFWLHPERVKNWGESAMKRYQENFRAEVMVREYMKIYQSLIQ